MAVVGRGDRGIAGFTMQVISYAGDPPGESRRAPGGGRVLTPAVLYRPAAGSNPQSPAIVMLDQGPGSHPLDRDQATRWAGERLAAKGYTVLCLYSGQERGFASEGFDAVAWAIRGGLDWLEVAGHERFVLVGQGYGAIAIAHYLASQPDALLDNGGQKRVRGAVLLNPLTELRRFPGADLETGYEARVAQAEASVAAGRGGMPSLEPGAPVGQAYDPWLSAGGFIAPAVQWLDGWGPAAAARNEALLAKLTVPTLMIVAGRDPTVSTDKLIASKSGTVELQTHADLDAHFSGREAAVTADIERWLASHGLDLAPRVTTRSVDATTAGGRMLQGVRYSPARPSSRDRPALILVGGRTADTVQSSTQWMGVRFAAKGYETFAPGLRVLGVQGFETSTHAEAAEDIGRWIDRIAALGYKRVVLAGHSNGGIWISNYMSLRNDPRVAGMIYFAPTKNTGVEARAREGEQWSKNLEIARAAVARGDDLRTMIGLLTARAWLDNNGPDTRGMHTVRVTEFERPALSITGAKDPLMSDDFVAEFVAAYRGKLAAVRYPDGSHGFRENKDRLAEDVDRWMRTTFRR